MYYPEDTKSLPCAGCKRPSGTECAHCGTPYCCHTCEHADHEAHRAVCAYIHDEDFVGISISHAAMRDILTPARELLPTDFGTTPRGVNAQYVLQTYVLEVRKPTDAPPIRIYGARFAEVGTGTKLFSKISARAVPVYIDVDKIKPVTKSGMPPSDEAVPTVVVILLTGELKPSDVFKSTDANDSAKRNDNAKTYAKAIEHIQAHQKVTATRIKAAIKKATKLAPKLATK